uniref:bifunctional phosphopantothenoylcysteine decarboxylase/phosphopantothenate--cysteine ligase CoaBC n=1 Tax=Pararhizobium sp. IMCC3301 TaxID=3067904 RepID=UPI002740B248|nr:bifunctional phosphopantothenoylcysteine decarboxylase/phosphopantothenate--cysteine ligase CoaBC [Pararhizobium sp. IMCC3301]
MNPKKILLIIGGGIAAYKTLELIRRAQDRGFEISVVMTGAAQHFVTPLSVSTLAKGRLYSDLFDRQEDMDVGHIRLSRQADIVVVAPATADLMAKMSHGLADDLASATLLANDKPVLLAPGMNPNMWEHPATRRNRAQLAEDGVQFVGPMAGEMAEANEAGTGRMAEPDEILEAVQAILGVPKAGPLSGKHVLITAGPTHEPIDPVRYIANRSSGKQGYAIARAAQAAGAKVTLVSGPVDIAAPDGVKLVSVQTARQMKQAVIEALPADIAIMCAAVADWRATHEADRKQKKDGSGKPAALELTENPDILAYVAQQSDPRPALVIGFAAETDNLIDNATSKRLRKGCDWLVANDVSQEGVMGGDHNAVHLIRDSGIEAWPQAGKQAVAERLMSEIIQHFQ